MSESNEVPFRPVLIETLLAGVAPASALLAGMQLDLFTPLAGGPKSAADLAAGLNVGEDGLSRLLYALVAVGLLDRDERGFSNTDEADTFLVRGRPRYMGGQHELLAGLWQADMQTAASIRAGTAAALHDYSTATDDIAARLVRGMHGSSVAGGRDLAQAVDFSAAHSVIDIAGGSGGLVAALCEANPGLAATLFELPRTARIAEDILKQTPGGGRVSIETGDILQAPPKSRHDVVVLRAFVQTLSRADAARALRHSAEALRPGGTIIIMGGGILDDSRIAPRAAVFLNVTLFNIYASGAAYTIGEHRAWLAEAGFGDLERIVLPNGGSILRAEKLALAASA